MIVLVFCVFQAGNVTTHLLAAHKKKPPIRDMSVNLFSPEAPIVFEQPYIFSDLPEIRVCTRTVFCLSVKAISYS